ncbi:MAG TPA: amidase [Rhizobiales bacterium]|nr:amidase [Hyphomicrobiales bacterium]
MTIEQLAIRLAGGAVTSRDLVEEALGNIAGQEPAGGPVFLSVDRDQARASADYMDALRKAGRAPSPYAGIPFSAKDLFDQAGQVTTAGSMVLKGDAPAKRDAVAIGRLKQAGFVCLGRTNMTEFAYSGVGLNPHYGTPKSIHDRDTGRIPGGSSSGAAVSVADGSCVLGVGTDTGGSCRVPAAFNGIVGYKSSLGRVPVDGVFPLAKTFDTVGPLARSVQCCATADAIMAQDWDGVIAERSLKGLRLGMPLSLVLDDLDDDVTMVFGEALTRLACHGVEIIDIAFPELEQLPQINAGGGIGAVEAYDVHAAMLAARGDEFDQRVRTRILAGSKITAHELSMLKRKRWEMISRADELMADVDAFIMPTTPQVPAAISDLDADNDYSRINLLALRNTFVGNFLNRCAISIPAHEHGNAPVGLMLMAPIFGDKALFSVAKALEAVLSPVSI